METFQIIKKEHLKADKKSGVIESLFLFLKNLFLQVKFMIKIKIKNIPETIKIFLKIFLINIVYEYL